MRRSTVPESPSTFCDRFKEQVAHISKQLEEKHKSPDSYHDVLSSNITDQAAMNIHYDLEQLNRNNFRACLEAMARPGQLQPVTPVFDSPMLAMASVLLYAEVSYHYQGTLDFELVQALCGTQRAAAAEADYLFFDGPAADCLASCKTGLPESPEFSATLIIGCPKTLNDQTLVELSGPGINGGRSISLPVSTEFINRLKEKNMHFPMGVDLFFILETEGGAQILGLPRTTRIEVNQ